MPPGKPARLMTWPPWPRSLDRSRPVRCCVIMSREISAVLINPALALAALVARAYIRTFPNNSKNNSIILKLPSKIKTRGRFGRGRRR
jgi:hypothetical protein